ncbi:MAG: isoleucine--tRNA ligase [Oscillospiraceae bacterium]|nr:isoleucine--tRNA ligase [Oscillospiraceae bacterium]
MDYNKTLNLPQTEFPMRASLPKREPDMLKRVYDIDLYHKILAKNEGKPLFVLHDGPPFSNGHIHMGTALNKCVKDFIVRYKSMSGYSAPYMPGWDNHGMPIESAIIKQNKLDRKKMSVPEFRDACKEFAENFINIQREQFKRLGVLGEWDRPYLTMNPGFEAEEVRIFGKMYEKGYIYKGKKPVYWCCTDETALAEAEIEYSDDACKSLYVKFALSDPEGKLAKYTDASKTFFVIWTTTPWTLPGNLAVCLNADLDYVLAKAPNKETYILAKDLAQSAFNAASITDYEISATLKGSEFEMLRAKHPLYDRESVILCGEHVTAAAGTGCVHTAPGHGMEDYEICRRYDASGKTNIGIITPLDDRGIMTRDAGPYEGMFYKKADAAISEDLEARGALFAAQFVTHQYPHCWRCKQPVVYRATDQWFCSIDALKESAISACESVQWIPDWGRERMIAMIRERSDWCISRQRCWGLPIPIFSCLNCGVSVCTAETAEAVANKFETHGSNCWFDTDAGDILPEGFRCPECGGDRFEKENDTLDCWFDSGSSHKASGLPDMELRSQSMYLEGADQFRGWFQSGLLTAVATTGRAPYDVVLTHGWTVDGDGKAMHKSLGNGVYPEDVIPIYGADLLRLWAASSDYRNDVRCSDKIFKQLSDIYLKIRNTSRYILGNLYDFDPGSPVAVEDMTPLDKWAVSGLNKLIKRCTEAYEAYEFHAVMYAIHRFCVVDMSNFYLDVLKDRLYCESAAGYKRRSAQSAIYTVLDSITRLTAPVLAFTADEIWQAMPHRKEANAEHVMLNDMPEIVHCAGGFFPNDEKSLNNGILLRDDVNKALEIARNEKSIGKPLDAKVTLYFSKEAAEDFGNINAEELNMLFITSETICLHSEGEGHESEAFPGVKISVSPAEAPKCARCWTHSKTVGDSSSHPELCARCAVVVGEG